MRESIRTVELQTKHRNELFALLRRNFGAWSTERLANRWEWQFGAGSPWKALRSASGLFAFDDGAFVGGTALFPIPWWVEGERLIFLCGGDFAVDQPYRSQVVPKLVRAFWSNSHVMASGLHPALGKRSLRARATLLPMSSARFTLPLRNRGWICRTVRRRLPAAMRRFVTPATAGRLLASGPVEAVLLRLAQSGGPPRGKKLPRQIPVADIRPIRRFTTDYNLLWEQARRGFRMTLDKDAEYLNWRYLDCPTFRQPILRGLYRDGKLSGIVVAGACLVLDEDRRPCGTNGEILELIAYDTSGPEIVALLISACGELDRRGVDKIGALACDATVRDLLERIGFEPEEDKRFDSFFKFDPAISGTDRVESPAGVYFTAGDGDMLIASLI